MNINYNKSNRTVVITGKYDNPISFNKANDVYSISLVNLKNIRYLNSFKYTCDGINSHRYLITEFRISKDNSLWSDWFKLDSDFSNFPPFDPKYDLFIEIKWTRYGDSNISKINLLSYEISGIYEGDIVLDDFSGKISSSDNFNIPEYNPISIENNSNNNRASNILIIGASSSLQGPQGPIGPTGLIGNTGPIGRVGPVGPIGPQGHQGSMGPTGGGYQGSIGPTGPIGPQGIQGPVGSQGIDGATGPQGLIGPQGDIGATGPQGNAGTIGAQGATGPQGNDGSLGPQGDIGPQGNDGSIGPQGITGPQGIIGPQGNTGSQGPIGPQGVGSNDNLNAVLNYGNTTSVSIISSNYIQASNFIGDGSLITGTAHLNTYYNTAISDDVTTISVGGLASGLTAGYLKTLTVEGILDMMLFPDLYPTYTIPSTSFVLISGISGTQEIGLTSSELFNSIFSKNDSGKPSIINIIKNNITVATISSFSTASISNIPAQYGYNDANNPNISYTGTFTDILTVTFSTTYVSKTTYLSGVAKLNNKGVSDNRAFSIRSTSAPQLGDTNFNSSQIIIAGVYPYFYGWTNSSVSAANIATSIQNGSATKVVASSAGSISVPYNASAQYIWFATPATSATKSTWFVTSLNTGSIGGSGNLFASAVVVNVTSSSNYWSNIPYKIYISNYATTLNSSMTLS